MTNRLFSGGEICVSSDWETHTHIYIGKLLGRYVKVNSIHWLK